VKILRLLVGKNFSIGILLLLVAKIDDPSADVSVERTQDVEDAGKIVKSGPRRCKLRFCVDDSVQWFFSMQVIGQNFMLIFRPFLVCWFVENQKMCSLFSWQHAISYLFLISKLNRKLSYKTNSP
jgi:hypothetical protein